ncbi:MAG: arylsulfatase [Allomuricauda sp.]
MPQKNKLVPFLLVFMAMALMCCETQSKQQTVTKPNVVFIMADDLGYGDIGAYGQEKIATPHLDKMAKDGMRFTQFYAGTSVCAPSRASLLTGRHTGNTRIRGNRQHGYRNGQMPLEDDQLTLAEVMKASEYRTGLIGKWGLGNPNTSGDPMKQGFDFYYGYTDQILAHNYFPEYLIRNGTKEFLNNTVVYQDSTAWHEGLGSTSIERKTYSNDRFGEEALEFLESNAEHPFFLYLALTLPHINDEQTPNAIFEVPDQGRYKDQPWTKNQKDYAAMVTRMDSTIGLVRAKLKALNLDKNTLIIFTSDNGPLRGHRATAFFNSNGPLRGGKRDLYEGGMRMPMLAVWPDQITPGITSDHIGAFWDVMPTLAELSGYQSAIESDGISFLPTLLGKGEQRKHHNLYWEFHNWEGSLQAVRKDNYKLVRFRALNKDSVRTELYRLSYDLGETEDIAETFPEIAAELDSLAQASRTPSEYFKFPEEKQ